MSWKIRAYGRYATTRQRFPTTLVINRFNESVFFDNFQDVLRLREMGEQHLLFITLASRYPYKEACPH